MPTLTRLRNLANSRSESGSAINTANKAATSRGTSAPTAFPPNMMTAPITTTSTSRATEYSTTSLANCPFVTTPPEAIACPELTGSDLARSGVEGWFSGRSGNLLTLQGYLLRATKIIGPLYPVCPLLFLYLNIKDRLTGQLCANIALPIQKRSNVDRGRRNKLGVGFELLFRNTCSTPRRRNIR